MLRSSRGVALIMVFFVVLLASIIVLNLTYSTFLAGRAHEYTEKNLKAEYVLKSALNLARTMIAQDQSAEDAPDDFWARFRDGITIPADLLQIDEPNLAVSLEIRPEDSKLRLHKLMNAAKTGASEQYRGIFTRLFQKLGFDDDEELDQTGFYKNRSFRSEELVANLIDYMDKGSESYDEPGFAKGIEGDGVLPDEYFPNTDIAQPGELSRIPGFTPDRLRKLMPFITTAGSSFININFAPRVLLESLHQDLSSREVDEIASFRSGENGPFTNVSDQLSPIVGDAIRQEIQGVVSPSSDWFQIIAKVDYGSTAFYMRALVNRDQRGSVPEIRSLELF